MGEDAAPELRADRRFVLEAIWVNTDALQGAAGSLRSDRALIQEAACQGRGRALKGASSMLRVDSELVLNAAVQDPAALLGAADELRQDRQFALSVVRRNGSALQFLDPRFKVDREVVVAAVKQNPRSLQYAHVSRRIELQPHFQSSEGFALLEDAPASTALALVDNDGGRADSSAVVPFHKKLKEAKNLKGKMPTLTCTASFKTEKSINFSALSTMTGNMGQGNYGAANIMLQGIQQHERSYLDSTCLLWGAVGYLGMRWKAFASQDFLQKIDDGNQLFTIFDSRTILNLIACRADAPEVICAGIFDQATRNAILGETSGSGAGGYDGGSLALPSDDSPKDVLGANGNIVEEAPHSTERRRIAKKDEPISVSSPQGTETSALLKVGDRVQLTGLKKNNGMMGTLAKYAQNGRWRVTLDNGAGNALLREVYLTPA